MKKILGLLSALSIGFLGFLPQPALANGVAMEIRVVITDTNQDLTLSADEKRAGVPLRGDVNVTVDWGDGSSVESFNTAGFKPHSYETAGTYDIRISGSLTHFGFSGNPEDRSDGAGGTAEDEMAKITEVLAWGNLDGLMSLEYGLAAASSLVSVPDYLPAGVVDVHALFIGATSFNDPDVVDWDTANVERFMSMFWGATSFNQPIGVWDTSSATDMGYMFNLASSFNQPLTNWSTAGVTTFYAMFAGASVFDQPLGHFSLESLTNLDAFSLHSTAMSPLNLARALTAWNVDSSPDDVELDIGGKVVDSLGKKASEELADDRNWIFNAFEFTDNAVHISPSRTAVTGFSGLALDFVGPILNDVDGGERFDAFDEFGEISLLATGSNALILADDYESCTRKLDGQDLQSSGDLVATSFEVSCLTSPISIAGGTLVLELNAFAQGSFVRYSVAVESASDITESVEVRFGGNLGSDDGTTLDVITESESSLSIISADGDEAEDLVIGYELNRAAEIRNSAEADSAAVFQGDDDLFFDMGVLAMTPGSEIFELEMFFVDWHPSGLASEAAADFAEQVIVQDIEFGFCLPMVRDGQIPDMVDECVSHPDLPTPINFAHMVDSEFVDVGEPSAVGFSALFENAAVHNGNAIDALVTIQEIEQLDGDELEDLDESGDYYQAEWDEWYLRIENDSAVAATEARAEITIEFQDEFGSPYQFPELLVNSYDIDDLQFIEFAGFTNFTLDDNTILDVRRGDSGWTRFEELNGRGTSSSADQRTISRVTVRYERVSSFTFVVGQTKANDGANYFLDISAGLGWDSPENPTGAVPQAVANFVDLPAVDDVAPRASSVSVDRDIFCTASVITISGSRLSGSSATVDGFPALVLENTGNKLVLSVPEGVATDSAVDIVITSASGATTLQNALVVGAEACSPEVKAWTKRISEDEVKIYAKNIVGAGKVQFFLNGNEIAWVRAVDDTDPKLRVITSGSMAGANYLVRTVDLVVGMKNVIEVYVDGVRFWRAAYSH